MPPKAKPSKKKGNKRKEEKHETGEPSHKRKRNNAGSSNSTCPPEVPPPPVNPQSGTVDAPQFHTARVPNVAGNFQRPPMPQQQRMLVPSGVQPPRFLVSNQPNSQIGPSYRLPFQQVQQVQPQRMFLPVGAGSRRLPVLNQQGNQMARPPYRPPIPPGQPLQQQRMILPIRAQPPRLPAMNQMARPLNQSPILPGQQRQQRLQFVPSGAIPPRISAMIDQSNQMAIISYGPPNLPGQRPQHQRLMFIRPSYRPPIIPVQQPQPQRMFVPSGVQPPRLSVMNQQGNQMARSSYRPAIPPGQPAEPQRLCDPSGVRPPRFPEVNRHGQMARPSYLPPIAPRQPPQPQRMIDPSGARPPQINLQSDQVSGLRNIQPGLLMLRITDTEIFCARVLIEPGISPRQMPPEVMNSNRTLTHPIVHFVPPYGINDPTNLQLPTTSAPTQPAAAKPSGRYYRCMDCLERFPTMTKLENHRRVHQSEPKERRIKCSSLKCERSFEDFDELDDHFKDHHVQLDLLCIVCGKRFVNSYDIIMHRQKHN